MMSSLSGFVTCGCIVMGAKIFFCINHRASSEMLSIGCSPSMAKAAKVRAVDQRHV